MVVIWKQRLLLSLMKMIWQNLRYPDFLQNVSRSNIKMEQQSDFIRVHKERQQLEIDHELC